MKKCRECGIDKPLSEYWKQRGAKDGLQSRCHTCSRNLHYAYIKAHPEKERAYKRKEGKSLRKRALQALGNRCSNPECRWKNEDGTLGCDDLQMLHIDHKEGGGFLDRRMGNRAFAREVLKYPSEFQLLCANCHSKKTFNVDLPKYKEQKEEIKTDLEIELYTELQRHCEDDY